MPVLLVCLYILGFAFLYCCVGVIHHGLLMRIGITIKEDIYFDSIFWPIKPIVVCAWVIWMLLRSVFVPLSNIAVGRHVFHRFCLK